MYSGIGLWLPLGKELWEEHGTVQTTIANYTCIPFFQSNWLILSSKTGNLCMVRHDVTEKKKSHDSLATTANSGGTHEVSRCLRLACLHCSSRSFQILNRILHLSSGTREPDNMWVFLLWNKVRGSCKQPLRQRWQMFPYIRLRK